LESLANFRAKHGKGEIFNVNEIDFSSHAPRDYNVRYYKSNKPGSVSTRIGY
jgi:hypothetical protein